MNSFDIAIMGLGVMGANLARNFARHGFKAAGYDIDIKKINALADLQDPNIYATSDLPDCIAQLKKPRIVLLMVPAGNPVDAAISSIAALLTSGDIIIDGGNSHFVDTDARTHALEPAGINLLGMGISGGEYGARHGPSLMPGGHRDAWEYIRAPFEAIAARADDGTPAIAYMGDGAAGHYVKMVHNGIEYALMRLISEAYDLMKRGMGFDNPRLSEVFGQWSRGPLGGYLIEITEIIFQTKDPDTGRYLIDLILDEAKQKGTGLWSSMSAMDLYVPTPTIDISVSWRDLSVPKSLRMDEARFISGPPITFTGDKNALLADLEGALYMSMLLTYIQGFALIHRASKEYDYGTKLPDVAQSWRAGCIIRSNILEDIYRIMRSTPAGSLDHLLDSPEIAELAGRNQSHLRSAIKVFTDLGIAAPGLMTALAYFDSFRSAWMPANLIQAQRDFFGAHTYERLDRQGTFHTAWLKEDA
jgi:6-phosphogluconate dehydrogenase